MPNRFGIVRIQQSINTNSMHSISLPIVVSSPAFGYNSHSIWHGSFILFRNTSAYLDSIEKCYVAGEAEK